MKTLRDALLLLVVILIVTTVRVSPLPEARLSPAQAAQAAEPVRLPAPVAENETAPPAGEAVPAHPKARPACDSTLAVQTSTTPAPEPGDSPCDA